VKRNGRNPGPGTFAATNNTRTRIDIDSGCLYFIAFVEGGLALLVLRTPSALDNPGILAWVISVLTVASQEKRIQIILEQLLAGSEERTEFDGSLAGVESRNINIDEKDRSKERFQGREQLCGKLAEKGGGKLLRRQIRVSIVDAIKCEVRHLAIQLLVPADRFGASHSSNFEGCCEDCGSHGRPEMV